MDYETAYVLAAIRSRTRRRPFAIMKTAFGGFTVFPAIDPSDFCKYEIVTDRDPIVFV